MSGWNGGADDPRHDPNPQPDLRGADPLGADDPVSRFFASARAEVRAQPGDAMHWQHLVRASRERRRSRLRGYLAGAAAAAVLVGSVVTGAFLAERGPSGGHPALTSATGAYREQPTAQPTAPSTPQQGSTDRPTSTATHPSSSRSASTPRVVGTDPSSHPSASLQPVPAGFVATSVSNAGRGTLFVMGWATPAACGGLRCPVLVRSADDGGTWSTVHVFRGHDVGSRSLTGDSTQSTNALTQVRFANPQVGWAFGGGVQVTRDGGRTWAPYPHPGGRVLSLETDGRVVVLAAASGCSGGTCSGPVLVASADVSAAGSSSASGSGTAGGGLSSARIALDRAQPYLNQSWSRQPAAGGGTDQGVAAGAQRVDRSALTPVKPPATCGAAPAGSAEVVPTAGSPGTVFALCPESGAAGSVIFGVAVSSDAGRSWKDLGATLRLANGSWRSFAAADSSRVVAVSGGGAGAVLPQVSYDGGRTWSPGEVLGPPPSGWRWVGAAGGGTYYAVGVADSHGFWRSTDYGRHWAEVLTR